MDNIINITNSSDHPTRPGHTIFRFYEERRSLFFTELLNQENIWFEQDVDTNNDRTVYYFGIKNRDLKQTNRLNYLVNAKFRKPTISNNYVRWVIYGVTIISIILIVIGLINRN